MVLILRPKEVLREWLQHIVMLLCCVTSLLFAFRTLQGTEASTPLFLQTSLEAGRFQCPSIANGLPKFHVLVRLLVTRSPLYAQNHVSTWRLAILALLWHAGQGTSSDGQAESIIRDCGRYRGAQTARGTS